MANDGAPVLEKLSDSEQTVETPEEDVRGRKVADTDGNEIGKIEDLLIDAPERKVRFLLVAHGGFLGLGEKKGSVYGFYGYPPFWGPGYVYPGFPFRHP